MKQLLTPLFLVCLSSFSNSLYAQAIVEFKLEGKTYRLNNSTATLAKNQENLYGLTISANDDSNSVVSIYLVDRMSAMPKLRMTDPPMSVGVKYKPAAGMNEASTVVRFPKNAKTYGSSQKYGGACLVNLATLSEKLKTVSGTFEGTITPIVNGSVPGNTLQISGRFTDVPLK